MMTIHTLNPIIDNSHVCLIVIQEWGSIELVYVNSLMKSQSHETRNIIKLAGGATHVIKVQEIYNTRPIFMSNDTT